MEMNAIFRTLLKIIKVPPRKCVKIGKSQGISHEVGILSILKPSQPLPCIFHLSYPPAQGASMIFGVLSSPVRHTTDIWITTLAKTKMNKKNGQCKLFSKSE